MFSLPIIWRDLRNLYGERKMIHKNQQTGKDWAWKGIQMGKEADVQPQMHRLWYTLFNLNMMTAHLAILSSGIAIVTSFGCHDLWISNDGFKSWQTCIATLIITLSISIFTCNSASRGV